jgi:hypothetical protein
VAPFAGERCSGDRIRDSWLSWGNVMIRSTVRGKGIARRRKKPQAGALRYMAPRASLAGKIEKRRRAVNAPRGDGELMVFFGVSKVLELRLTAMYLRFAISAIDAQSKVSMGVFHAVA